MNYNDDQNDLKKSGKREFVIDKAALGKGALPHPELNNSGSQKAVIPILAGGGLSMLALSVVLVAFFLFKKNRATLKSSMMLRHRRPPHSMPNYLRCRERCSLNKTSDKNLSAAQLVSKGSQVYAQKPGQSNAGGKIF